MQKLLKYIFFALIGLVTLSLILSIRLPLCQSFRIVFGSVYVLFLPGLVLSFVFFPFRNKEIDPVRNKISNGVDIIERIALSFALSIAVVPLLVFYLNLIGMKINLLNVSLVIAFIILISFLVIYWQRRRVSEKKT